MAVEITIPRLGWNMDEGVFVAWLKEDGAHVKEGDAVFSLETDKAVQEIESMDAGRLQIAADGPQPGQTVAVGTVIGVLHQDQEVARESVAVASRSAPAAIETAADTVATASPAPGVRLASWELTGPRFTEPAAQVASASAMFWPRRLDPARSRMLPLPPSRKATSR